MYDNFVMGFGYFLFIWQVDLQVLLVVHFIMLSLDIAIKVTHNDSYLGHRIGQKCKMDQMVGGQRSK
jgi:hypothetical protein